MLVIQRIRRSERHVPGRWQVLLAAVLLSFSLVPAALWADQAAAERRLSAAVALASFDQVWERVRDQYFDFERIEADWEQGRERLRPKAAAATSPAALRVVLNELLDLIGESHFGIIASATFERLAVLDDLGEPQLGDIAANAPRSATGLSVRWVDEKMRVAGVRPDSPAAAAGIEPGWSVVTVDNFEVAPAMERIAGIDDELLRGRASMRLEYGLQSRLSFPRPQRDVILELLDADGERQKRTLQGVPLRHGAVQIGNLPPMTFDFRLDQQDIASGCVSIVSFTSWVPALIEEFRSRRDAVFACQGLVFDLRGNPGGVVGTMSTLASDLFSDSVVLATLLRTDARLDFRVMPRRVAMDGTRLSPFDGPVAILIDGMSGSTSELFASGMQATERAKLFGARSAGEALPSRTLPLASGDFLLYAFADAHDSLGRRIEGVGVHPDFPVVLTAENIHSEPVLRAALSWIETQLTDS